MPIGAFLLGRHPVAPRIDSVDLSKSRIAKQQRQALVEALGHEGQPSGGDGTTGVHAPVVHAAPAEGGAATEAEASGSAIPATRHVRMDSHTEEYSVEEATTSDDETPASASHTVSLCCIPGAQPRHIIRKPVRKGNSQCEVWNPP